MELSQKLYARLLAAYPRRHREEYGGAMAQLFRDQCRDAWAEGRTRGLLALWFRTLPDLIKTSLLERLSTLNPGKHMSDKLNAMLRPRHSPGFTFFTVFAVVFLLVFGLAVAVTFILPETYSSTARVNVAPEEGQNAATTPDATFLRITPSLIASQNVLSNVVNALNLSVTWGKKHFGGETLKTAETLELLKRRLDLKPVRNTTLLEITAFSEDKTEAAQIANTVAKAYADYKVRDQQAAFTAELNSLQARYQEQVAQIEKLRADQEALAQKFDIVENSDAFKVKYQDELVEGEKVCNELETQIAQLKTVSPSKLRDVLPTLTQDSSLPDLLAKLQAAQQQYAVQTNDYALTDLHITRLQSVMNELNREIDARVAGMVAGLQAKATVKRAGLEALSASVTARIQKLKPTPETQPYWDSKRDLAQLLSFHQAVEAKIQAVQFAQINPRTLVQITDLAEPSSHPVKPNKPLNIFLGAMAGLFFGGVAGSVALFISLRLARHLSKPVSGV
jgi:uncharacterized protein involved in exopolysaccharide biosynthesis